MGRGRLANPHRPQRPGSWLISSTCPQLQPKHRDYPAIGIGGMCADCFRRCSRRRGGPGAAAIIAQAEGGPAIGVASCGFSDHPGQAQRQTSPQAADCARNAPNLKPKFIFAPWPERPQPRARKIRLPHRSRIGRRALAHGRIRPGRTESAGGDGRGGWEEGGDDGGALGDEPLLQPGRSPGQTP